MAEAAKEKGKFAAWLVKVGKFFRDTKAEIRKIVWPTPKVTFRNMGVVLIAMIVVGLFIFGLDTAFGKLLGLIMEVTTAA